MTINKKQQGFTLIELVVVMSLFMLILGVTVSIFISVIRQQKRVLAEQELLGQVQYAQEYVSTTLRQVKKDVFGNCLIEGRTRYPEFWYVLSHYNEDSKLYEGIKVLDSKGDCQEIFFDRQNKALQVAINGQDPQSLLSNSLDIVSVVFVVNGDESLYGATDRDMLQPRVTVVIRAHITVDSKVQEKQYQFTVSKDL